MRDLARAALIALAFFLLSLAASGSSTSFFAGLTAAFAAVNVALLALSTAAGERLDTHTHDSRRTRAQAIAVAAIGAAILFTASRGWLEQIVFFPNDSQRADMLVVVEQGIRRVLQGRNPYTMYHVPWDATLPYGPVLWAPFVVPYVLHADIRFATVMAMAFVPALCALAAASLAGNGRRAAAIALLFAGAAFAFSRDVRLFTSMAHTPVYWPLLALLAWLVTRERWLAAAAAAGLLVVARTTMIAAVPVLLFAIWQRDRRRLPPAVAILAATTILPFLPFAIADPGALSYAMYGSYPTLMKGFVWTQTTWVQQTIGVTGLLLRTGTQRFMEIVQAAAMVAVYAAAWRSMARGGRPLPWMAMALAAFSFTTYWPVLYIYFDVLVLWICAMVAEAPWPPAARLWPAWTAALAGGGLAVAAATVLDVARNPAIDVGTADTRPLLYRGFSAPEGSGLTFAWIEGTEAEVLLPRRSRADARITLTGMPNLPTRESTQQISVTLNGTVLGTAPMREGWSSLSLDAPSSAWLFGVNRLRLSLSSAVSPKDAGTGDDPRKLAAAIDRITVEAK